MAIKNKKRAYMLKYTTLVAVLLLLYVMQTTPRLFVIMGAKPILVVPFAIALAMYEGEFVGGIFGIAAGILCDMGSHGLFGYSGIICGLACISIGLLIIYLMRCNVGGCILFVLLTMLLRGSVGYFFAYGIWNYEGAWRIFTGQTLPTILYTTAVTPLLYYFVRALHRYFQNRIIL